MLNFDDIKTMKGWYWQDPVTGQPMEVVTFNGEITRWDSISFNMRINYPELYGKNIESITKSYKEFISDLFECSLKMSMVSGNTSIEDIDLFEKDQTKSEKVMDAVVEKMTSKLKTALDSIKTNINEVEFNPVTSQPTMESRINSMGMDYTRYR